MRNSAFKDIWVDSMSSTSVGAGLDTIPLSLTTIISQISFLAGCQSKLHAEIDAARESGQLDEIPSFDQTAKLPYLNAYIHEAMRVQPIIVHPSPRKVPKGGLTIRHIHVPEGTTVGVSPQVAHHSSEIFGEDASKFNPSRWTSIAPEKAQAMDNVALIWRGTNRSCPGQFLAKLLLLKFVAALFLRFEVEVLTAKEAAKLGYHFQEQCHFVMGRKGIMFRLHQRQQRDSTASRS